MAKMMNFYWVDFVKQRFVAVVSVAAGSEVSPNDSVSTWCISLMRPEFVCQICQRQFSSLQHVELHNARSELHRSNLKLLKRKREDEQEDQSHGNEKRYDHEVEQERDEERDKERAEEGDVKQKTENNFRPGAGPEDQHIVLVWDMDETLIVFASLLSGRIRDLVELDDGQLPPSTTPFHPFPLPTHPTPPLPPLFPRTPPPPKQLCI